MCEEYDKKNMKYFILIAASAALYVSNPGIQDFSFFLREQANNRMRLNDETANVFVAEFLSALALEATYRTNYFIASKVTIDTSALRLFEPDMPMKLEVLGIAGQFITLSDFP